MLIIRKMFKFFAEGFSCLQSHIHDNIIIGRTVKQRKEVFGNGEIMQNTYVV